MLTFFVLDSDGLELDVWTVSQCILQHKFVS